jgi:hypothetical protein
MDPCPPLLASTNTSSLACGPVAIDVPIKEVGMRRTHTTLSSSNRLMPCYVPKMKAFKEFTHHRVGPIPALTQGDLSCITFQLKFIDPFQRVDLAR